VSFNKDDLARAYREAMANHYPQYVRECNLCGHLVPLQTVCQTCDEWFSTSRDPNVTREAMLLVRSVFGVVPRILEKSEDCG